MLKLVVGFLLLFVIVLVGFILVKPIMAVSRQFPRITLLVGMSACLAVLLSVMIVFLL